MEDYKTSSSKPHLVYNYGWRIENFSEVLQTTEMSSIERRYLHLALAWCKKMSLRKTA